MSRLVRITIGRVRVSATGALDMKSQLVVRIWEEFDTDATSSEIPVNKNSFPCNAPKKGERQYLNS